METLRASSVLLQLLHIAEKHPQQDKAGYYFEDHLFFHERHRVLEVFCEAADGFSRVNRQHVVGLVLSTMPRFCRIFGLNEQSLL